MKIAFALLLVLAACLANSPAFSQASVSSGLPADVETWRYYHVSSCQVNGKILTMTLRGSFDPAKKEIGVVRILKIDKELLYTVHFVGTPTALLFKHEHTPSISGVKRYNGLNPEEHKAANDVMTKRMAQILGMKVGEVHSLAKEPCTSLFVPIGEFVSMIWTQNKK